MLLLRHRLLLVPRLAEAPSVQAFLAPVVSDSVAPSDEASSAPGKSDRDESHEVRERVLRVLCAQEAPVIYPMHVPTIESLVANGTIQTTALITFVANRLSTGPGGHCSLDEAEDALIELVGDPGSGYLPKKLKYNKELVDRVSLLLDTG